MGNGIACGGGASVDRGPQSNKDSTVRARQSSRALKSEVFKASTSSASARSISAQDAPGLSNNNPLGSGTSSATNSTSHKDTTTAPLSSEGTADLNLRSSRTTSTVDLREGERRPSISSRALLRRMRYGVDVSELDMEAACSTTRGEDSIERLSRTTVTAGASRKRLNVEGETVNTSQAAVPTTRPESASRTSKPLASKETSKVRTLGSAFPSRPDATPRDDVAEFAATKVSTVNNSSSQNVTSAADDASDDAFSPWQLDLLNVLSTQDSDSSQNEGPPQEDEVKDVVEENTAPAARQTMSMTPRPFSPQNVMNISNTGSSSNRDTTTPERISNNTAASAAVGEATPASKSDVLDDGNKTPESDSKVRFSFDFLDVYFHGACESPAPVILDDSHMKNKPDTKRPQEVTPMPVHLVDVSASPAGSSESANSNQTVSPVVDRPRSDKREDRPTTPSLEAQRSTAAKDPAFEPSLTPPPGRWSEAYYNWSPSPALTPALTPQTVSHVAATASPSPALEKTITRRVLRSRHNKNVKALTMESPKQLPTPESILSPCRFGSAATSVTWPAERNVMAFAVPQTNLNAPAQSRNIVDGTMNNSAPYLRPQPRKSAETTVSAFQGCPPLHPQPPPSALSQPQSQRPSRERQQRRAALEASNESLPSCTRSVSFVLEEDEAQLAMLSSQRMSLAQPRLD